MRRAVASALAAALAFAGVAGCSHSRPRARTTPVAVETSPPPEPLTPQTAAKAFRDFVTNDDVARAAGDERLALWWTSEGQAQLTAAQFRTAVSAGRPVPRYRYESPVFYVPRLLPSSPQWFVVSARRVPADGGRPRTVLMGFVRAKSVPRWRLSLSTLLDKKQKPPKIAVGADGYAKALATFDDSLVIQPRLVPSIQATLAEEGPHSIAARVMATGRHTTEYYADDQKITKSRKTAGLHSNAIYNTPAGFPIFPLATTDGGGMVLYALSRDAVTSKSKKKPGRVPVPPEAAPFIDPALVHNVLDVSQTLQFAAIVPPKPKKGEPTDKAVIIGADGGVVDASVPAP